MLVIRASQMERMRQTLLADYRNRLCEYLRTRYPSVVECIDDPDLSLYIDEAVKKATFYGIKSDEGVFQFAVLGVLSHGTVWNDFAVQKFFQTLYPDSEAKIRWLTQLVIQQTESSVNNGS